MKIRISLLKRHILMDDEASALLRLHQTHFAHTPLTPSLVKRLGSPENLC